MLKKQANPEQKSLLSFGSTEHTSQRQLAAAPKPYCCQANQWKREGNIDLMQCFSILVALRCGLQCPWLAGEFWALKSTHLKAAKVEKH